MVYLVQIVQLPLTRQYLFSLALPIAVLVVAIWFHCTLGELVVTIPGVDSKLNLYQFLIPSFAFWLLLKKACDLRVWLWLSAFALVWGLPVGPACALLVIGFSLHRRLRIAGLGLLAPWALIGVLIFIGGLFENSFKLDGERIWQFEKPMELQKVGSSEVYIHEVDMMGIYDPNIHEVRVDRKITPFLAFRKVVYKERFGWIDKLRVIDEHTIQFNARSYPDEPVAMQIKID